MRECSRMTPDDGARGLARARPPDLTVARVQKADHDEVVAARLRGRWTSVLLAGLLMTAGAALGELWMLWWGLGLLVVVGLLRIWGHWGGGWAVASTALLAVGVGLAASLVYALLDPNIPKGTSVTLSLIGMLPLGLFVYLGSAVAYGGMTGRRAPGVGSLSRVLERLNRPI